MQTAKIILDKDYEIAPVDPKVFGSFVEPLGRCIYGGIYVPEKFSATLVMMGLQGSGSYGPKIFLERDMATQCP